MNESLSERLLKLAARIKEIEEENNNLTGEEDKDEIQCNYLERFDKLILDIELEYDDYEDEIIELDNK